MHTSSCGGGEAAHALAAIQRKRHPPALPKALNPKSGYMAANQSGPYPPALPQPPTYKPSEQSAAPGVKACLTPHKTRSPPPPPTHTHTCSRMPGVKAERIWEAHHLDPGLLNMGHLDHAKRLLDKLNSGKRIVAVAFGSSLIHDYAG